MYTGFSASNGGHFFAYSTTFLPFFEQKFDAYLRQICPFDAYLRRSGGFMCQMTKRLVKKVRFRGDFGLLFEVQAEHYDDVVKGRQEIIQADGEIVTRLTLEVRGWQWVKR